MRIISIEKNESGQRMDKFLKKYFKEAGSGFLYKMLRKKNILLNDKKAEGKEMLKEGDTITLYLAEDTIEKFRGVVYTESEDEQAYPTVLLDILYEDSDFMIINKPAGILSQKSSDQDISMVEYIIGYLLSTGQITARELETFHPSVCNRLDRNTSGLILAGKSLSGLQFFSRVLKERSIKKYYLCLVRGKITEKKHCKAYLKKDLRSNQVRVLERPEKDAAVIETSYEPLWGNKNETLLKVELITGKSHQIRSHLASMGYPLAGDPKYGDKNWNRVLKKNDGLDRQFLHAWQIEFPDFEGVGQVLSRKVICAPLPQDLKKVLNKAGCNIDINRL
ncbi:MAG: RluA family pseudouridine synthase [Oliverpabstia sp.]